MSVPLSITIAGRKEEAMALREKIKELALKQGKSISEFVVDAIVEHLRRTQQGE